MVRKMIRRRIAAFGLLSSALSVAYLSSAVHSLAQPVAHHIILRVLGQ